MKKTLVFLLLVSLFFPDTKAQFNPVRDLAFTHTYIMPYNCFSLSWSPPDTSPSDTLVGFNIYRDSELFMFTGEYSQSCQPCLGMQPTPFCSFMDYNFGMFYMHVTAVYNASHQESGYTDSINFGGVLIGMAEPVVTCKPGIISAIQRESVLSIQMNQVLGTGEIILTNLLGQCLVSHAVTNESSVEFRLPDLNPGIYCLLLISGNHSLTRKIFIKQ
jgi:hypothetical protein